MSEKELKKIMLLALRLGFWPLKALRQVMNHRCLNVGGGSWAHPGWENLDFYSSGFLVDHVVDLRAKKPLPLPDGSTRVIFCSHVLEHLNDDTCLWALQQCRRILRVDGVMRISVPDMDKAVKAYRSGNELFFSHGGVHCAGNTLEGNLVSYFASFVMEGYGKEPGCHAIEPRLVKQQLVSLTKYDFVRWCVSLIPKEAVYRAHVNGYDFDKLRSFLIQAGFSKVVRSTYRGSAIPSLRRKAFDNRPRVSLFVEAFR